VKRVLSVEDQTVWDQLSPAAKKTILDHKVECQNSKPANTRFKANIASSSDHDNNTDDYSPSDDNDQLVPMVTETMDQAQTP
jgi:hypothetical protein